MAEKTTVLVDGVTQKANLVELHCENVVIVVHDEVIEIIDTEKDQSQFFNADELIAALKGQWLPCHAHG